MRAAFVRTPGPADSIVVGDLPAPGIGPTDVLVRTLVMSANHVDTFVRSGSYRTPLPSPFVIGRDLVGEVAAVGDEVTGFAVGDRVWCNSLGHGGRQGSYAEYSVIATDRLYHLPDGVDPDVAVTVAHTGATAYLALFRQGEVRVGDTVFIGGAGGGVGSAAVQFAHAAGARVIATAAAADQDWCREIGADLVLDYRDDRLADRIRDGAPGGLDVHLDTSGHHDFETTLPLMAPGGRVIVMAAMGAAPALPIGALYTRDLSLRGFAISNASIDDLAEAARTVNALLAKGLLRNRIGVHLQLSDAARAHQLLEHPEPGQPRGRIVLHP